MYTLAIGNKTYSSWSLRPWLLLKVFKIEFEEKLFPLFTPEGVAEITKLSPSGLVPALIDGDIPVWDSLAIIDYLADNHSNLAIWPKEKAALAHSRSMAAEMHGGLFGIRNACPMNLGAKFAEKDRGEAYKKDVKRICQLINEARSKFSSGGKFLYGEFTATDAMFAPVVSRLETYSVSVDEVTREYMDNILNIPAFKEWREDALLETWVIDEDEVNEEPIELYKNH